MGTSTRRSFVRTTGLTALAVGASRTLGGIAFAQSPEWDRVVLEECYDQVDAISLHRYFGLNSDVVKDDARFLASNLEMERQIEDVAPRERQRCSR
jgi:alpha-L-arabinofuranosidase